MIQSQVKTRSLRSRTLLSLCLLHPPFVFLSCRKQNKNWFFFHTSFIIIIIIIVIITTTFLHCTLLFPDVPPFLFIFSRNCLFAGNCFSFLFFSLCFLIVRLWIEYLVWIFFHVWIRFLTPPFLVYRLCCIFCKMNLKFFRKKIELCWKCFLQDFTWRDLYPS